MKNGAWKANVPKIYKYLLQDEQKPTVHEKKWSEMLSVHCIEKPVGLFDQWFCMNICISFIGHCKSKCSREMLKIYIYINMDVILFFVTSIFMPPAWKVRRGHLVFGSSVRPSVRPFVCLSVRNSVPLTFRLQYIKYGWSYSNQTWTVSSSKGCSHLTDITCPLGWGGVKIWHLKILPYFDFVAAGGIRVSQTHV